jgi:hypothetical protein
MVPGTLSNSILFFSKKGGPNGHIFNTKWLQKIALWLRMFPLPRKPLSGEHILTNVEKLNYLISTKLAPLYDISP